MRVGQVQSAMGGELVRPASPARDTGGLPIWRGLGVGPKIFSGYGVAIGLTVIVGLLSISRLNSTVDEYDSLVTTSEQTLRHAQAAGLAWSQSGTALRRFGDSADPNDLAPRFFPAQDKFEQATQALQKTRLAPEARQILDQIIPMGVTRSETATQGLALTRTGRSSEVEAFVDPRLSSTGSTMDGLLAEFVRVQLLDIQQQQAALGASATATQRTVLGGIGLLVLLSAVLATVITRSLTGRLKEYLSFVDGVSRGNLSGAVKASGNDELTLLGVGLNRMTTSLRELSLEIQGAVADLSASSGEILDATGQRAMIVSDGASVIAQTTAAVNQVSAAADQALQTAEAGYEASQENSRVADDGLAAVGDAIRSMSEIRQKVQAIADNILALSEQSQQIAEIIATVGDLADQSNLLALNAAIEASRAGEHGKGFSVVAGEIRNLAEQSKSATEQVRTLLSDIQRATNAAVIATEQGTKGVDSGAQLMDQAGKTIGRLAEVVQRSGEQAGQSALAMRQISLGMEQIASAMETSTDTSERTSALVTDIQRSTENLSGLAAHLDQLVRHYRV